ncbi:MAG: PfkB family carbohydrate kinase, partial [Sediminibacterium sp.]|nr:PfkB family carbohydrate kinase [Sediminibacterium sp.]
MKQFNIICYGEILLRFITDEAFGNNKKLNYFIGGAELNVARHLANFNFHTNFVSILPNNYLSLKIIHVLKKENINTNHILLNGNKMGIFFVPKKMDMQNQGVIYDRVNSAFYKATLSDFNWQIILKNKHHFHTSAITTALNKNQFNICLNAIKTAYNNGLNTSFDLNYRNSLWQYTNNPPNFIKKILPYCNTIIGNLWSVEKLIGIKSTIDSSKGKSISQLIEAAEIQIKTLTTQFKNIKNIGYTFRLENTYFAVFYINNKIIVSNIFNKKKSLDSVGSGDSFMATFIYGLHNKIPEKKLANLCCKIALKKLKKPG